MIYVISRPDTATIFLTTLEEIAIDAQDRLHAIVQTWNNEENPLCQLTMYTPPERYDA